jgi:hypothetical protein
MDFVKSDRHLVIYGINPSQRKRPWTWNTLGLCLIPIERDGHQSMSYKAELLHTALLPITVFGSVLE